MTGPNADRPGVDAVRWDRMAQARGTTGKPCTNPGRPVLLAGALVGVAGLLDVLSGASTLTSEPYFVITEDGISHLHTSGWVMIHLITGIATMAAGLVIMVDRRWTTLLGVGIVLVGIVIDLLFLPYDPLQALLAIDFEVVAIVILIRHRRLPVRWPG